MSYMELTEFIEGLAKSYNSWDNLPPLITFLGENFRPLAGLSLAGVHPAEIPEMIVVSPLYVLPQGIEPLYLMLIHEAHMVMAPKELGPEEQVEFDRQCENRELYQRPDAIEVVVIGAIDIMAGKYVQGMKARDGADLPQAPGDQHYGGAFPDAMREAADGFRKYYADTAS